MDWAKLCFGDVVIAYSSNRAGFLADERGAEQDACPFISRLRQRSAGGEVLAKVLREVGLSLPRADSSTEGALTASVAS